MTMFDAASSMESAAIRADQALDLLQLITDDMEESNPITEAGSITFADRFAVYRNALAILRRELESISADLNTGANQCRKVCPLERKAAVQYGLAAFAAEGVDIAAVLHGFGYKTLGDVPPEQYGALLAAARKAKDSETA